MSNYPEYTVIPASGELGSNGALRLSGYHELVCFAAESDLTTRAMSISQTTSEGFAWAITAMVTDVIRPVTSSLPIKVRTWLSAVRSPICRRELEFFDSEGVLFRTAVYSVPVNIHTHSIMEPDERMIASGVSGEPLVENASPRLSGVPKMPPVSERLVYPSDIDPLGHMNNCRYGAMIFDALSAEERKRLNGSFRYTINFRRQLFENAKVIIGRGEKDGCIYINGTDSESGKTSFVSAIELR